MKRLTIEIKAKHFKDTNYLDPNNCALAKAIKDHFEKANYRRKTIIFNFH